MKLWEISTERYSAKLFIHTSQEKISLRAHDRALKTIAQKEENLKCEDLLFAPPFDISYNKYHVITEVCRK